MPLVLLSGARRQRILLLIDVIHGTLLFIKLLFNKKQVKKANVIGLANVR